MQIRRIAMIVTVVAALALLLAASSTAAGPPVEGGEDSGEITTFAPLSAGLTGTVASKISYQGRLTDAGGNPLDGSYNLVFQLWDDATAGSQVGGDIVRNNVPVSNGLFTVELDVPQDAFTGQALWLRIQVNGQWLSPRQELLPVPYALSLRPGAQIVGDSADPVAEVTNQGLGAAIQSHSAGVGLDALGQTGVYAVGWAVGVDASGMTGVRGQGDIGVRGDGLTGVHGESEMGYGVVGVTSAPMTVTAAAGVYGESMNGHGVEGRSQFDVGVYGHSSGGFGAGVGGSGVTGVYGTGGLVGVSGYTENDDTTGVLGMATGYNSIGVEGNAQFGTGVVGTGETGVKGTSSVYVGVRGEGSAAGVEGVSQTGDGVSGETQGDWDSAAIRGVAIGNGYGGYFTSTNSSGVVAYGYEGLHAEATSDVGYGVHGMGALAGVHGEATSGYGVSGEGVLGGVFGTSTAGHGVEGRSQFGAGVLASSESGTGVSASSTNDVAVYAAAGTVPLILITGKQAVVAYGEENGVVAWGGQTGGTFEGSKGVYGESSADYGEGVHGHGTGSDTEGVLGTSDQAVGVWGVTSATWGLGTPQNLWVGGSCTGCTVAFVGQNEDTSPLEVGDVVSISGIAAPLKGQQTPVLQVLRATSIGGGALGVVQARAAVTAKKVPVLSGDSDQTATIEMPDTASGRVAPGDYLFIVVQGLVQVRADASSGAIQVGDVVGPAATAGLVQKLSQDMTAGPVLGRALEPLTKGTGLIWVLVLGR